MVTTKKFREGLGSPMAPSFLLILSLSLALFQVLAVVYVGAQEQGSYVGAQEQGSFESDVTDLVNALRNSGRYVTAATVIALFRSSLIPSTTLLVPTDEALRKVDIASIPQNRLPSLLRSHVLEKNLSFNQLKLFPVDTWIPTVLPGFFVKVTSNTPSNFSFDNARVVDGDLCPATRAFIECLGVDAVLNETSFGTRPGPAGPTAPSPAPAAPPVTVPVPVQAPANIPGLPIPLPLPLPISATPSPSVPRRNDGGTPPSSGASALVNSAGVAVVHVAAGLALGVLLL